MMLQTSNRTKSQQVLIIIYLSMKAKQKGNGAFINTVKHSNSETKYSLKPNSAVDYDILTGKRIRTQKEIQQNIKVRRVHSYQKISFNIRKMDQIFKAESNNKIGEASQKSPCKSLFKQQLNIAQFAINVNRDKSQIKKNIGKLSKQKLITCNNFNKTKGMNRNNLCGRVDLLQDSPKPKITNKGRFKTQYFQDLQQIQQIQKEILELEKTNKNLRNVFVPTLKSKSLMRVLSNEKQQKYICQKQGIPGVKFKTLKSNNFTAFKNQTNPKQINSHNHTNSIFSNNSQSNYIHIHELLDEDNNNKIEQMYQLRNKQLLYDPPKQWQFYNCLKLGQISLYKTNLKLSCENWVLIDYLELKYLRGWNPKESKEFSIAIKLYVSCILLQLIKQSKIDFNKIRLRVNNQLIHRKVDRQLIKNSQFSLANNTIISVWDLFIGMLVSSNSDIIWQLIYTLSYIYRKHHLYCQNNGEQLYDQDIIILYDQSLMKEYQAIFVQQCQRVNERLGLDKICIESRKKKYVVVKNQSLLAGNKYQNSVFKHINQFEYLSIKCTSIDVAVLFMDCLTSTTFRDVFVGKQISIPVKIKYQVGFKFWQHRIHSWQHDFHQFRRKGNHVLIGRNSNSHDFGMIAFNDATQSIVICNDVKTNMSHRDLQAILSWMKDTFKRFKSVSPKREHSRVVSHIQC